MPSWKPSSNYDPPEYEMNPYDSFMKKHLQHYGYYTGRNALFRENHSTFRDWDHTHMYGVSNSDSSESESDEPISSRGVKDRDDLRTTQLVYSFKEGKMVPRLREPRQLYAINSKELGPQQAARWPSEIEVLPERVKHILNGANGEEEPFYKKSGNEHCPWIRGEEGTGEVVYEYEPRQTPFFLRSRVGGYKGDDTRAYVYELTGPDDPTLIFESRFESANLAKVVKVGAFEYELWLRPDYYTDKHTQWFYFRVSNTRANVNYRFTIVNFMKPDSLYNHGMKPLIYSNKKAVQKKIGWVRTGKDIVYYKCNARYVSGKSEKCHYALTWTCQMPYNQDTVYLAHCYPYTYTDLQDYLMDISNDPIKSRICKQRVLCRTLAGNLVYVLTITSPSYDAQQNKLKKAVVITSRVHPGESNASWMLKGFLDFLTGNTADAKLLRDTFVFKIVPMLNPDGVIVGNYRCSLAGRDLNRNYKTVLKDSFPSVWYTKNMIRKLKEEREIVLYCDLHGHSRKKNVFIYGCENRYRAERRLRERIFPVMLSRNSPDKFSFEGCKFKIQKSKEGTGRIVMWNMGIMNSYTMEATFSGSGLGKKKGYHFSAKDLEEMGFDFCDTLLDYCDPDKTKADNILAELEERMRQEILEKLQKVGQAVSPTEINLDEDYTSGMESSDGGSDSSISDGLPVHLQYLSEQLPKKKTKRLRSKKERDKQRTPVPKKSTQATSLQETIKIQPVPQVTTKEEVPRHERPTSHQKSHDSNRKGASPAGHLRYTTVRPKSRDDRTNGGIPCFTQERSDERAVKKSDYLEAITNAYLQNGVLQPDDQTKEGDRQDDWQASGSRSAGKMSPAGQRLNSAILNSSLLQKHIVEIAAAQRLEEARKQSPGSNRSHEDVRSETPMKQHPPPFDASLDKQRSHDAAQGKPSNTNSNNNHRSHQPINLMAANYEGSLSDRTVDVTDPLDSRQYSPPLASNLPAKTQYNQAIDEARTSTTDMTYPPPSHQPPSVKHHPPSMIHPTPSVSGKRTHASQSTHTAPVHASRHQASPIRPAVPTEPRLDPAKELRMTLVNSAMKANLSPTTGRYIDRIMKQTEGEIKTLTAELEKKLEMEKRITNDFVEERREFSQKTNGFTAQKYNQDKSGLKQQEVHIRIMNKASAHDMNANVVGSSHNTNPDDIGEMTSADHHYGDNSLPSTEHYRDNSPSTNQHYGDNQLTRNNRTTLTDLDRLACGNGAADVIDHFHRESSAGSGSSRELRRPKKSQNKIGESNPSATVMLSSRNYESQNSQNNKNLGNAPTKISLMIARGHRGINQQMYMGTTFRPLGKTPRPPLLRNLRNGTSGPRKQQP